MEYYDWQLIYTDGKVSHLTTVGSYEYNDQLAYCQEGIRAGWLERYKVNYGGLDI